ncbi:hypothetical protein GA0061098_1001402 [Bradyrhizobium shewense]|uniref:Uncharacterized protein n=1 Tax=Bradyrhizobium shewense TaxID=1761772 RepID=A0A1C3U5P1_9BRAD|nr:hypothetical protein GA0061098_1001402 [Bradyrhizobium shewense]
MGQPARFPALIRVRFWPKATLSVRSYHVCARTYSGQLAKKEVNLNDSSRFFSRSPGRQCAAGRANTPPKELASFLWDL